MSNKTFILKAGNTIFLLFIVICGVFFYLQNNSSKVDHFKSINNGISFQDVSNMLSLDEILKILSNNAKQGGYIGLNYTEEQIKTVQFTDWQYSICEAYCLALKSKVEPNLSQKLVYMEQSLRVFDKLLQQYSKNSTVRLYHLYLMNQIPSFFVDKTKLNEDKNILNQLQWK